VSTTYPSSKNREWNQWWELSTYVNQKNYWEHLFPCSDPDHPEHMSSQQAYCEEHQIATRFSVNAIYLYIWVETRTSFRNNVFILHRKNEMCRFTVMFSNWHCGSLSHIVNPCWKDFSISTLRSLITITRCWRSPIPPPVYARTGTLRGVNNNICQQVQLHMTICQWRRPNVCGDFPYFLIQGREPRMDKQLLLLHPAGRCLEFPLNPDKQW
jgi:hypothetical protein